MKKKDQPPCLERSYTSYIPDLNSSMNFSSNSASTTYLRKTMGNDFQKEFINKNKKDI